ncbi:hypothetical protein TNCV_4629911 [Trichonephila clavipes]|nr:hypothetical protein TNCV_4629911 [Trichonephila clavipes]
MFVAPNDVIWKHELYLRMFSKKCFDTRVTPDRNVDSGSGEIEKRREGMRDRGEEKENREREKRRRDREEEKEKEKKR